MKTVFPKEPKLPIPKSKYEFNLAEFPVTMLSKRLPKNLKIIEYEDTIIGKGGKLIPRTWRVKPSVDYGFGTSEALGTLFELFQIWKEQGFETPTIRFGSIYNLVKHMDLENTQTAYQRIRKDLNALVEISIEAKNAFWDNEKKAYVDKTFHLFNEVTFYRREGPMGQQPLPFAYIQASDALWGSIQANSILTAGFSGKWFRSLSPGAQRLALYLSKMFHSQSVHRREITKLAEQLPLYAQSYKKIKQQFTKSTQELLEKGYPYLKAFHYEKQKTGKGENIVFHRKVAKTIKAAKKKVDPWSHVSEEDKAQKELLLYDILDVTGDPHSGDFYRIVTQKLDEQTIRRAISETKAASLQGDIRTTPARYFTDLIQRYATDQRITLNPRK